MVEIALSISLILCLLIFLFYIGRMEIYTSKSGKQLDAEYIQTKMLIKDKRIIKFLYILYYENLELIAQSVAIHLSSKKLFNHFCQININNCNSFIESEKLFNELKIFIEKMAFENNNETYNLEIQQKIKTTLTSIHKNLDEIYNLICDDYEKIIIKNNP